MTGNTSKLFLFHSCSHTFLKNKLPQSWYRYFCKVGMWAFVLQSWSEWLYCTCSSVELYSFFKPWKHTGETCTVYKKSFSLVCFGPVSEYLFLRMYNFYQLRADCGLCQSNIILFLIKIMKQGWLSLRSLLSSSLCPGQMFIEDQAYRNIDNISQFRCGLRVGKSVKVWKCLVKFKSRELSLRLWLIHGTWLEGGGGGGGNVIKVRIQWSRPDVSEIDVLYVLLWRCPPPPPPLMGMSVTHSSTFWENKKETSMLKNYEQRHSHYLDIRHTNSLRSLFPHLHGSASSNSQ